MIRWLRLFAKHGGDDSWDWNLDLGNGYTVSGVYHMLSHVKILDQPDMSNSIWNKASPLVVSLFSWKLLRNQLQTKDNLL